MRIHPSAVHTNKFNWRIYAATAFAVLLAVAYFPIGTQEIQETIVAEPKMISRTVVLTKRAVPANAQLAKETLVLAERPASTLSADAIESLDEISGKVSLGPIPANYPLSRSMLIEAAPVTASTAVPELHARASLQTGLNDDVSVAINFGRIVPKVGQRIALNLKGKHSRSALVADEAFVTEVDEDTAYVRVNPSAALFLEEAKALGQMSFLVISNFGDSPYKEQVVSNLHALRAKLDDKPRTKRKVMKAKAVKARAVEEVRSFAWSPDGDYYFGISNSGKIREIRESRVQNTLRAHRLRPAEPKKVVPAISPAKNTAAPITTRVRIYRLPPVYNAAPKKTVAKVSIENKNVEVAKLPTPALEANIFLTPSRLVAQEQSIVETDLKPEEAAPLINAIENSADETIPLPTRKEPEQSITLSSRIERVQTPIATPKKLSKSGEIVLSVSMKRPSLAIPSSGHIKQTFSLNKSF